MLIIEFCKKCQGEEYLVFIFLYMQFIIYSFKHEFKWQVIFINKNNFEKYP